MPPGRCVIEGAEADFLVLELIHGKSLSQAMRDDRSRKQKLQIAEQIAAVLVAAHGKGVVHRDLKPDNVMLTERHLVKVLDFGLSLSSPESRPLPSSPSDSSDRSSDSSDRSSGSVTTQGTILGTLGHMSPEAARGEVATPASDLYSFGLMLQELFTGKSAYARTQGPHRSSHASLGSRCARRSPPVTRSLLQDRGVIRRLNLRLINDLPSISERR